MSVLPAMRGDCFALLVKYGVNGTIEAQGDASIISESDLSHSASELSAALVGPGQAIDARPHARAVGHLLEQIIAAGPVPIATWEPDYGRLAEAQVKWEAAHGRPLGAGALERGREGAGDYPARIVG